MSWVDGVITFLVFTFPQTMIYTWFGFRFLGLETRKFLIRLSLFSLATSSFVIVSLLTAPSSLHPLLSIGLYALFISIFFSQLRWKSLALLVMLMLVNIIVGELLTVMIVNQFMDFSMVKTEQPFLIGIHGAPGLLLVAVGAYLMQRYRYYPGKHVASFFQEARQTPILYFVFLIFTQVAVLSIFIIARFLDPNETAIQWLLYIGIVTILVVSFAAIRLIVRTRDEAIRVTQNAYVGDLMQVFTTIRGQRHDFINHVQVMYSMLTLNKQEPLKRYMEEVVSEIQSVNRMAERIPSTALGAFIQAKTAVAIDKKIRFVYALPELPDTLSTVRSIDLVRIVGNLVDNAFDEVVKLPEKDREVSINMTIEESDIVIVVSNPGEPLSDEDQERILAPGYSTKHGDHSGLGLPIVMERTRYYGGTLGIDYSASTGTVNFTVRLPADARIHG